VIGPKTDRDLFLEDREVTAKPIQLVEPEHTIQENLYT